MSSSRSDVRTISSVLVANRGEIARRVFRTAATMGIRTVAVFVDEDTAAPFVADADHAIRLPGTYLDGDAIIAAAQSSGADAIHPGYGFLSENAAFAQQVLDAGLVWVGPPPGVIATMGDKLEAKKAATAAGVPTLQSSKDPTLADAVGYPLLVKASAGGGGKGMRIVTEPEDLSESVTAAQREAASSFGDDTVFLERYVPVSRHVEIQILGDRHGRVIHLGERECSIQRRHQKIIEEAPSPAVDNAMRDAMGSAALALARSIGYESAGTVEFLVDEATGEFFFLEVNTRLQVEHPVTEAVTGVDLVREQLRVAAGEELSLTQDDVAVRGHAIEARLYAEDASRGFLPAIGSLDAFAPEQSPFIRWDSGVEQGSVVGVHFDPMLAKVISHAPTRSEAASHLARALEQIHLGGVVTNRVFLAATLRSSEFLAGHTTTDFIERVQPNPNLSLDTAALHRAAAAGALWIQGHNRAVASVLAPMPSGFRNSLMPDESVRLEARSGTAADPEGERLDVRYRRQRDGSFRVRFADLPASTARVHSWSPTNIDVEIDGHRWTARVTRANDALYVQVPTGTAEFLIEARFAPPATEGPAGGFSAPMPGTVLEVRVVRGEAVASGQVLVVLEAMKMEHHMTAPADGVVAEVRVTAGTQVETGQLLLVFEADAGPVDGAPAS